MIKLAGKLPKHEDRNGLDTLTRSLIHDPSQTHVAVIVFDTAKIVTDVENYDVIPTVRVVAIEPIAGDDAGRLRAMLQRAHEERTGNLELPAEWEAVLSSMASPTLPGTDPR